MCRPSRKECLASPRSTRNRRRLSATVRRGGREREREKERKKERKKEEEGGGGARSNPSAPVLTMSWMLVTSEHAFARRKVPGSTSTRHHPVVQRSRTV